MGTPEINKREKNRSAFYAPCVWLDYNVHVTIPMGGENDDVIMNETATTLTYRMGEQSIQLWYAVSGPTAEARVLVSTRCNSTSSSAVRALTSSVGCGLTVA